EGGGVAGGVGVGGGGGRGVLGRARDVAGNRREVAVPVRVDRTPPSLSLLSPPEGAPVDGRGVPVAGATDDSQAVTVTVNGQPAERLERGWRVDLSTLPPGKHVLEAVARDEAGNETRAGRTGTGGAPPGAR